MKVKNIKENICYKIVTCVIFLDFFYRDRNDLVLYRSWQFVLLL